MTMLKTWLLVISSTEVQGLNTWMGVKSTKIEVHGLTKEGGCSILCQGAGGKQKSNIWRAADMCHGHYLCNLWLHI